MFLFAYLFIVCLPQETINFLKTGIVSVVNTSHPQCLEQSTAHIVSIYIYIYIRKGMRERLPEGQQESVKTSTAIKTVDAPGWLPRFHVQLHHVACCPASSGFSSVF